MPKSIDADVAPARVEPLTEEHAPHAYAFGRGLEDSASGCEYVDDRLRLDD
jgi:hypothetical protein